MKHHGSILRERAKAKGFDIQGVANDLGQHRVTVEKDFRAEKITRKVYAKYAGMLELSIDDFFPAGTEGSGKRADTPTVSLVQDLYRALLHEKDERIKLLEQQVRFFPKAVQVA